MFGNFRAGAGVSWIVVFLGNPGLKYQGTRHNAGFMAADEAERAFDVRIDRLRFKALTATAAIDGQKVLLMKPQTYMNLSGEAARQAMQFYKLSPERVIVVSDDVALPIGKMRIRASGSAGGHNGLKSIISCLGSSDFPRIRMGVGAAPHPDYDMADWVLGTFKNQDADDMRTLARKVPDAIRCLICEGTARAMNKFN